VRPTAEGDREPDAPQDDGERGGEPDRAASRRHADQDTPGWLRTEE